MKRRGSKKSNWLMIVVLLVVYLGMRYSGMYTDDVTDKSSSDTAQTAVEATYTGNIKSVINDNIPNFTDDMMTTESYEKYGRRDSLGRCTEAIACLSTDTMPAKGEERGDIHDIHPSGWRSGYGWERCHLIAWSLGAENANQRNLITGTHEMNTAMNEYEIKVARYLERTGNHVIYRVTPVFSGDNLVADGIQLEAKSVEDNGAKISFNVFFHNISPGKTIDYKKGTVTKDAAEAEEEPETYVLNTNSHKFHRPSCDGVDDIWSSNKKTVKTTRSDLIHQGYDPCGICEP